MTWEEYVVCAVFAIPFVWHLVRGRFKEALFVFGLFLLFCLSVLVFIVTVMGLVGDK